MSKKFMLENQAKIFNKSLEKANDEIECLAIMHEENLNELRKAKEQADKLQDAYDMQRLVSKNTKAQADKLAEALECCFADAIDHTFNDIIVEITINRKQFDKARQALKEYRGEK